MCVGHDRPGVTHIPCFQLMCWAITSKVMWQPAFTRLSDSQIWKSSEQIFRKFSGNVENGPGKRWITHSAAVDEGDTHNSLWVLYKTPKPHPHSKQQWRQENQAETSSRTSGIGSDRCSCWCKRSLEAALTSSRADSGFTFKSFQSSTAGIKWALVMEMYVNVLRKITLFITPEVWNFTRLRQVLIKLAVLQDKILN